jgi:nitrous oxide reductase
MDDPYAVGRRVFLETGVVAAAAAAVGRGGFAR